MSSLQEAGSEMPHNRVRVISAVIIFSLVCAALFAVASVAWVSDDSFITFRYVNNALTGHGAVYNIGEHVLGYTHPLWFLTVLAGSFIFADPVLVAAGMGLTLTFLLALGLGVEVYRGAQASLFGVWAFAIGVAVLVSSDPWLSFQTGGLENPLSHLLILLVVVECVRFQVSRPGRVVLFLTLLCLCRPDFVFFSLPVGLLVLGRLTSMRDWGSVLLAASPGASWLLFAWLYYGHALPNTGVAKLAVYPSWVFAVQQGVSYAADWFIYDTLAASAMVGVLILAAAVRKDLATRAVLVGIVLQTCWVIWAGGDFMRGRFFMGVLTAGIVLGVLILVELSRSSGSTARRILSLASISLVLVGSVSYLLRPAMPVEPEETASGIVNERLFYPGHTLVNYLRLGRPDTGSGILFVNNLRSFVAACGPVTLHSRHPGTLGYQVGPDVSLIDTLGLTDRYIAKLPRAYLTEELPRPGHPDKYIPVAYLIERGDVGLVQGWYERIAAADCSLKDAVKPFDDADLYLAPGNNIVKLTFAAD